MYESGKNGIMSVSFGSVQSRNFGYSCGEHKDAVLVKAFSCIKQPLTEVEIFHTDRGKSLINCY